MVTPNGKHPKVTHTNTSTDLYTTPPSIKEAAESSSTLFGDIMARKTKFHKTKDKSIEGALRRRPDDASHAQNFRHC